MPPTRKKAKMPGGDAFDKALAAGARLEQSQPVPGDVVDWMRKREAADDMRRFLGAHRMLSRLNEPTQVGGLAEGIESLRSLRNIPPVQMGQQGGVSLPEASPLPVAAPPRPGAYAPVPQGPLTVPSFGRESEGMAPGIPGAMAPPPARPAPLPLMDFSASPLQVRGTPGQVEFPPAVVTGTAPPQTYVPPMDAARMGLDPETHGPPGESAEIEMMRRRLLEQKLREAALISRFTGRPMTPDM